jgi:hypothetical protein
MVTLGNFLEFEHEIPKVTFIQPKIAVLIAGDALRGSKITNQKLANRISLPSASRRPPILWRPHTLLAETPKLKMTSFGARDHHGWVLRWTVPWNHSASATLFLRSTTLSRASIFNFSS